MSDAINPILVWMNANPELAGLATFIISAIESIAIIGTIIPGSVMMTAIGALAGSGVIPLWPTLIWAILGAIVGDGISYWIGFVFKDRLHYVWPFRSHPYLLATGEKFFYKHGGKSVFIGRFVGPVRALVPLVAGMLGMSPIRFTIANVLSAIGWAPAYMLPGILLGAASLELPPDIAVHVILMLVLISLFIILCLWLILKTFKLISNQINQFLTLVWNKLRQSRYFHIITTILKHYNSKKTYGQLTLAFYFLLVCLAIFYLAFYIRLQGGAGNIFINNTFFYLFRSFRTPVGDQIMLAITFLGEKSVLLPLIGTLFIWFAWKQSWHTAWHVLGLGIITAIAVKGIKMFAHSMRPWGILSAPESFSFPSGHTTLAVVFYIGIALLLIKAFHIQRKRPILILAGAVVFVISISRLYLGVHWLTDVIAGWLLGTAILIIITISYNRKAEKKPLKPLGIILTILLTLCVTYSISTYRNYDRLEHNFTQLDWPTYTITLENWWNHTGDFLPVYRINRFGLSGQVLNLQWVSDLDTIKKILLLNGWELPPARNWVSVVHRISDVHSTEHLPIVSPLYLDKNPSLVLVKHVNGNKKLVVLRLWNPNRFIQGTQLPLWVGTVEVAPRTYSWIFNRTLNSLQLTQAILFGKTPELFDIKEIHLKQKNKLSGPAIILIKPKT